MPRITISDIDLKRGERLRKFRIDKNFTRKDLGRIAGGYAQGTVYNWEEKGGGIPNLALVNLRKIDCDLIYLLTGKEEVMSKNEDEKPPHDLTIRNNLKKIRHQFDEDQMFKLCRYSGVDIDDWIDWENGEGWPSKSQMDKIAVYSGIDPDEIDKPLPEREWPMPIPEKYKSAPPPGMASNKPTRSRPIDSDESESLPSHDIPSQIDTIFRLQESISHVQLQLASAGRHVADGQSLKTKEDAALLGKYAQNLVYQLQGLLSLIQDDGNPPEAGKSQPVSDHPGGNQNHTA